MKREQKTAILELVAYLDDERKHYEQMLRDGEDTSKHIYNSVKLVSRLVRE